MGTPGYDPFCDICYGQGWVVCEMPDNTDRLAAIACPTCTKKMMLSSLVRPTNSESKLKNDNDELP